MVFTSNIVQKLTNSQNLITTSGKSVKLLKGESTYNALAYSGLMAEDQVSDMMKMLDSNESKNVKYNTLRAKLQELQHRNTFMQFTLCKETVKEMM